SPGLSRRPRYLEHSARISGWPGQARPRQLWEAFWRRRPRPRSWVRSAGAIMRTANALSRILKRSIGIFNTHSGSMIASKSVGAMSFTIETKILSYEGAQKILAAAIAKATEMKVPQCISIVDAGGHLLAFARMDGAFAMSMQTSLMKAKTAASYGEPTGNILAGVDIKLAIATHGERINLPGGLPIIVDNRVIRAIGVGSGRGEQDRQVASAAIRVIPGARQFDYTGPSASPTGRPGW